MSQVDPEAPDRVERLRRLTAPPVALLASMLAVSSLLSAARVLRSLGRLDAIDPRFVGWVGVGATSCVAVAAGCLFAVRRIGSGPPLAVGTAVGVFGLALGHQVGGRDQLALAIVTSGLAAGALLGGVVGMASALPDAWSSIVVSIWGLVSVAAWPLLVRMAPRPGSGPALDVVVHPPVWTLAVATVVIVGWSILTMLVEPVRTTGAARTPTTRWTARPGIWWLLVLATTLGLLLITVVGFEPRISLVWLRPLVIVATAAVLVGWGLVMRGLPASAVRISFVGVSVVAWMVPATVTFAVAVADGGPDRVAWLVVLLLAAAACVGSAVGLRGQLVVVPVGLAIMSAAAVATWVAPTSPWIMGAAVAPLLVAASAVFATSLRVVVPDADNGRLIGLAAICSLVLGCVVAVPLSWAMLGDIPGSGEGLQAASRLYAGLTVALSSLAATSTWVGHSRLRSALDRTRLSPAPAPRTAIDLQDLTGGQARPW